MTEMAIQTPIINGPGGRTRRTLARLLAHRNRYWRLGAWLVFVGAVAASAQIWLDDSLHAFFW